MLTEQVVADLKTSGLTPEDIRIRQLSNAERAATGLPVSVQGYVLPYFGIDGLPIPFYRVKCFDVVPKYKQLKASGNYVYFPKDVMKMAYEKKYIIITEGEKKAVKACKEGFPCVALGGVDSWRNRTLILPQNTKFQKIPGKDNQLSIKLEDYDLRVDDTELARGLQELIDISIQKDFRIIICYDTDPGAQEITKINVQKAAANLGFELRFRGVRQVNIKQMFLPVSKSNGSTPHKMGLDDFLIERGPSELTALVTECLNNPKAAPRQPNIIEYVAKKLQTLKLSRKASQQLAMSILSDMDVRGNRMRNTTLGNLYYFINKGRTLMSVSLEQRFNDLMQSTEFSRYLFKEYGIGASDQRVMAWLATYFNAEEPIGSVTPYKTLHVKGDTIFHQLNDGQYIRVSPESEKCMVVDNGTDNVLFESGCVEPMDGDLFIAELRQQMAKPLAPLWPQVTAELRLRDKDKTPKFLALLFYLSPWIQRWRGTQLPVEMFLGEAGSGKSSAYELRLNIQIGRPDLRNAPNDLRDWYASIASTGGMHVTDNLHAISRDVKSRLSDEMCRLVTEPYPHIEQRKLYTNNELVKLPVNPTFAVTAIQQPFRNADLMQRSIVVDFDKGDSAINFVSNWAQTQMEKHGGRVVWLAHQMQVLHQFLKLANTNLWDNRYKSKHRLINLEQSLRLMHHIIFPGESTDWIVDYLWQNTEESTQIADWAFEGLCAFASYWYQSNKSTPFNASNISDWATDEPDFKNNMQLTSSRSLGRYIQTHKQQLATVAGIKEKGKYANLMQYHIEELPAALKQSRRG